MAVKNLLKEKIKIFKKYVQGEKVPSDDYYKNEIKKTKELLVLIKEGKLTPAKFDKLNSRYKWDIYWSKLLKKVSWHCGACKCEMSVESPFMGEMCCGECEAVLSRRTGGGQSNPFEWTFKKLKK